MSRAPLVPAELLDAVDATLRLLETDLATRVPLPVSPEPLPSLLEQCQQSCARIAAQEPEPIRTLHRFFATDKDKIGEYLAHIPNTYVLDGLDPLGDRATDLLSCLRQNCSRRPVEDTLLEDVFTGGLTALYRQSCDTGMRLVLGEQGIGHTRGDQEHSARSALCRMVRNSFPALSVLIVRHPLDSFLERAGTAKDAGALEQYARQYHAFLDAHEGLPVLEYEDLLYAPGDFMERLCGWLDLPFDPEALGLVLPLEPRLEDGRPEQGQSSTPYQDIPQYLLQEMKTSPAYAALCTRLGYHIGCEILAAPETIRDLQGLQGSGRRVLINTIPKSGTYFMGKLLKEAGLEETQIHLRSTHYWDWSPSENVDDIIKSPDKFKWDLPISQSYRLIAPGFTYAHLDYTDEAFEYLDKVPQLSHVFVVRNLRNALVSSLKFEDQWRLANNIIPRLTNGNKPEAMKLYMRESANAYLQRTKKQIGWWGSRDVYSVRYEDMIGKNGSDLQRDTVNSLFRYIRCAPPVDVVGFLAEKVMNKKTRTLSATPSNWQDFWSDEAEKLFDEYKGAEMNLALGYENDAPDQDT